MKFSLGPLGSTFSTRPRGAQLREEIQRTAQPGEQVILDFSDVLAVSSSFADEFVGELATARRVEVIGASDEVGRVVRRVLDRRADDRVEINS
jgi:hypothetical protein